MPEANPKKLGPCEVVTDKGYHSRAVVSERLPTAEQLRAV
jgi:hypothetical protein